VAAELAPSKADTHKEHGDTQNNTDSHGSRRQKVVPNITNDGSSGCQLRGIGHNLCLFVVGSPRLQNLGAIDLHYRISLDVIFVKPPAVDIF